MATEVLGDYRPFFAPVAALVTLSISGGRRGVRALEIAIGVTVGVAIADALTQLLGSGSFALMLIVLLAMSSAVLLGGSVLAVTQAGVSAAFVVTLEQPDGFEFARTGHAAIGAASALLMSFVVLPVNPLRLVRQAGGAVLREMAATLDDIATALEREDVAAAHAALLRARAAEPLARDLSGALTAGRETAIAALPRRHALSAIEAYTEGAVHLELAMRNARYLARGAVRALEVGDHVPPGGPDALRELAAATRALEPWLEDRHAVDEPRRHAIAAAATAGQVLELTGNLSISVIVGGVRTAAVDLLRTTGMTRDEAVAAVREAATP